MRLCPLVFGPSGLSRLEWWHRRQQSGCDIMPITDSEELALAIYRATGWLSFVVDMSGMPWGQDRMLCRAGWMRAQVAAMCGPVMVCDTDWVPLRPFRMIPPRGVSIGMCPDLPPARSWPGICEVERQAGLMWLADPTMLAEYANVINSSLFIERCAHVDYCDQIAWSAVYRMREERGEAWEMPYSWNDSHRTSDHPGRLTIHHHGLAAKRRAGIP